MPPPPDGVILRPPSSARVKKFTLAGGDRRNGQNSNSLNGDD